MTDSSASRSLTVSSAPPRLRTSALVTTITFLMAALTGCFNTYRVGEEEFRSLQTAEQIPRTVTSVSGEQVVVDRETPIYVRSVGGRRYPITPFNFKMSGSQLVASDRDTLLALGEIQSYEVDLLSTPKTVGLIALGVAVATGLIVFTVVSASDE